MKYEYKYLSDVYTQLLRRNWKQLNCFKGLYFMIWYSLLSLPTHFPQLQHSQLLCVSPTAEYKSPLPSLPSLPSLVESALASSLTSLVHRLEEIIIYNNIHFLFILHHCSNHGNVLRIFAPDTKQQCAENVFIKYQ